MTLADRPILFSAPMVRALLAGAKTQTRRPMNPQPDILRGGGRYVEGDRLQCPDGSVMKCRITGLTQRQHVHLARYGENGICRLWVRETWAAPHDCDHLKPREIPPDTRLHYAADAALGGLLGRPSIFMPRWASRITLEVTEVRVERLQDISEADAIAEGIERSVEHPPCWKRGPLSGDQNLVSITAFPVLAYRSIWEQINGPDSWRANPWVWAISFRRV